MSPRAAIPQAVRIQVLTEAGYRCAVPTCRTILALDLHHMEEVTDGGGNDPGNLIALCPTCHALYTRGTISRDSIYVWKLILISLSHAFDGNTIDDLLFLTTPKGYSKRTTPKTYSTPQAAKLVGVSLMRKLKASQKHGPKAKR